jgi:hypothetical protein
VTETDVRVIHGLLPSIVKQVPKMMIVNLRTPITLFLLLYLLNYLSDLAYRISLIKLRSHLKITTSFIRDNVGIVYNM